jgi:hypothetical protein
MNRRGVAPLFLGAIALLGAMCSNTGVPVAGPTEEQGNPQIVAVVVDDLHRPIASATVFVYKVPVYHDSNDQPPTDALLLYTSETDSNGACSFEKLVPGTYSLTAIDADSAHSGVKSNIVISTPMPAHPEYQDTLVLAAPGGFHGVVTRGGVTGSSNQQLKDAFIQIKLGEIDRSTVTGPDGKYAFYRLPAGVYTAYYYATDGFYSSKREHITIRPSGDTALDSVVLKPRILPPPKGFLASYDTSAGIVRCTWQKVIFDGLWYYAIDRKCITSPSIDASFTTFDTVWTDTLGSIPAGTTVYYVVRSIDKAFNPSLNAGPIEITVAKKD